MTSPSQWDRGASLREMTPFSPALYTNIPRVSTQSPILPNTSKSRKDKENQKEASTSNQKRTRDKKEKYSADDRPSSKDQYNNKTFDAKKNNYETVLLNIPSCIVGLPQCWNSMHDRFIAYLATHAPLDENGMVRADEEVCERWSSEEISEMLSERFEVLRGVHIKTSVIEMRLDLLDQAGDNDYFKMPYGAFAKQHWGKGI
ncbi:hypothetical protein B0J14DRAFT_597785 [Halenospora varia]|nr:hypothetical protein B0J14DRAFT_597785 [Halenospora varia]